jgi:DNA polymerase III sliding clamp (beta) subunit (PCNA family)
MKIKRTTLLETLQGVSIGLSKKVFLEQSNAFVFTTNRLITFNDEILASVENPLDFEAVIIADDLLRLLSKIPDDEIDIKKEGEEVIIKGKRKSAGVTCQAEVLLPIDAVPEAGDMFDIEPNVTDMLKQAARSCGQDETQFLSTCVHVTPKRIEACDNFRFFRINMKTGFGEDVLIPAGAIHALTKNKLKGVCVGEGWAHFHAEGGLEFSVRCSHANYHQDLDSLLKMEDEHKISLPANLAEIVSRAEVMNDPGFDARIAIKISEGKLVLSSRKDTGWYKERKRIKYTGEPFEFYIHPQFLVEVLGKTREILIDKKKIKFQKDDIQFVTALCADFDDGSGIPF